MKYAIEVLATALANETGELIDAKMKRIILSENNELNERSEELAKLRIDELTRAIQHLRALKYHDKGSI